MSYENPRVSAWVILTSWYISEHFVEIEAGETEASTPMYVAAFRVS